MEWSSLIDEASAIINSEYPSRKEMVQLSRIEFNMAVAACSASTLAAEEEEKYNMVKSETTLVERGHHKSITEASEIGKNVAEREHGCYRSMKEKAKGMRNVISSVRGFKISVYSSEKENDEQMFNNYKDLSD